VQSAVYKLAAGVALISLLLLLLLLPTAADACSLQVVEEDEYIAQLHARAEKFDPQAERTFGYLQVS
jgi:hypothetical protein